MTRNTPTSAPDKEPMTKAGPKSPGLGFVLAAQPLALIATIVIVQMSGISLHWALPIFGTLATSTVICLALLPLQKNTRLKPNTAPNLRRSSKDTP
jgi:hypothetical protein